MKPTHSEQRWFDRGFARIGLTLCPLVLLLTLWQVIAGSNQRVEFVMGSPLGIARSAYGAAFEEGVLFKHFFVTAMQATTGFALGVTFGTFVGLALCVSSRVAGIVQPYLLVIGSIPVFALGPVIVYWFGTGSASKIALAFLASSIVAIGQAYAGASAVDQNLLRVVRAFGGSRFAEYRYVIVPSSLLWVLSGVRIAIGAALVGAVVGEFLSSRAGLGHMIVVAEGLFDLNRVFVGVLGIAVLSLSLNLVFWPLERWAARWHPAKHR